MNDETFLKDVQTTMRHRGQPTHASPPTQCGPLPLWTRYK